MATSEFYSDGYSDIMERWTLADIAEKYRMIGYLAAVREENTPKPSRR